MQGVVPSAVPCVPLATWLDGLSGPGGSEILLGGSGHLLLSAVEEANVVAQLREGVLPRLFPDGSFAQVCVLTGLAPGSDLLFARVLSGWLLERDIPFRMVGLLPVPPDVLLEDWLDSMREAGDELSPALRAQRQQQIDTTLNSCEMIVDLLADGTTPEQLADRNFREQQYRHLAACLAQRSDILIAILRRNNAVRPGGTAEVVDWRRNPHHIPAEFCTDPPPPADAAGHRLIVIDPAVEYAAQPQDD